MNGAFFGPILDGVLAAAFDAIVVSLVFGALLFGVVWLVVRSIALDAALRHVLWMCALFTTALMPLGSLAVAAGRSVAATPAQAATQVPNTAAVVATLPNSAVRTGTVARATPPGPTSTTEVNAVSFASLARLAPFARMLPRPDHRVALVSAIVWLAGAGAGLGALAGSLLRIAGLKKRSKPLDAAQAGELPWPTVSGSPNREISIRLSDETETPVAVGFFRPVILIPTQLARRAGLGAIAGLVLHENAHLLRYDDWTNLAGRLIERLCWFNPLVWALGRRIALEREIAADDAVVRALGRPHEYAQSLWELAREMRLPEHAVVAPGAFFTRKQISVRIEALLERRPVAGSGRRIATLVVGLSALGCTAAAAATAPVINVPGPTAPTAASAHSRVAAQTKRVRQIATAQTVAAQTVAAQIVSAHDAATRIVAAQGTIAQRAATQSVAAQAPIAQRATAQTVAALASTDLETDVLPPVASATDQLANVRAPAAPAAAAGEDLSGRDLRGVDWRGRTLEGTDLAGADLRGARLDNTRFIGADLSGARLDRASLTGALMTGTNIAGMSLRGAATTGLRIIGASLAGSDLRGLDLRSIVQACAGCDLRGADLRNADLHGLRLSGVDLEGADLRGVNLRGAMVVAANLDSAELASADLRDATFTGCSVDGANFGHADTRGTRFIATRTPQGRDEN